MHAQLVDERNQKSNDHIFSKSVAIKLLSGTDDHLSMKLFDRVTWHN